MRAHPEALIPSLVGTYVNRLKGGTPECPEQSACNQHLGSIPVQVLL